MEDSSACSPDVTALGELLGSASSPAFGRQSVQLRRSGCPDSPDPSVSSIEMEEEGGKDGGRPLPSGLGHCSPNCEGTVSPTSTLEYNKRQLRKEGHIETNKANQDDVSALTQHKIVQSLQESNNLNQSRPGFSLKPFGNQGTVATPTLIGGTPSTIMLTFENLESFLFPDEERSVWLSDDRTGVEG